MSNFTYDKLGIIAANGGFQRASLDEIVTIISNKMRDIYGADIDLSSASPDAQYIMMESAIIDNVYSVLSSIYKNMNPSSATDNYLDILCALTNVYRKEASQSVASIYIKNVTENTQTITKANGITVIDKNNITWHYYPIADETISAGEIVQKDFICDLFGPFSAIGTHVNIVDARSTIPWDSSDLDSINGAFTLVSGGSYKIYQADDAILGNVRESDESLRARQRIGASINSYTTVDGLRAALYNLESLDDVYIYNNASSNDITTFDEMSDGATIEANNVYIALRYKSGVSVNENKIAEIIFNRMTPGIVTQDATGTTSGTAISNSSQSDTIYWKKCTPINPTITLTYLCQPSYNSTSDFIEEVSTMIDNNLTSYTLETIESSYYEWIDENENRVYTSTSPASAGNIYSDDGLTDAIGTMNSVFRTSQENWTATTLMNYINNTDALTGIKIGDKLLYANLISRLQASDLQPGSMIAQTCSIVGGSNNYFLAPCTYFNYTKAIYSYTGTTATLTFS